MQLPLFPLHTVLFPGTLLHLNIFEPRYKIMLRKCLAKNEPFGVVLIQQGQEAFGPISKVFNVGCTAHIMEIKPTSPSSYNLTAFGYERFRILELYKDRPYLTATVNVFKIEETLTKNTFQSVQNLIPLVKNYLDLLPRIEPSESYIKDFQLPENPVSIIHKAASILQLPGFEKQLLLEAKSLSELAVTVERLYRREITVINQLLETTDLEARRAAWLN